MTAVTAADRSITRKLLCFAAACACSVGAVAGPAAPVVSAGSASYNAATLTVTTTSARTQIIWPSFNVAAGEVVKFVQPNAQSLVLNQVFDSRSLSNLGGVSSNGSVYFLSDGRVSGAGVNLDLAGTISTSLRVPRMALASERAAHPDRPMPLATLAEGSVYVIGADAQALTTAGGDVLLNPGRTVELAHAAMLNLRVLLTAPGGEAINLSRLVGTKRETGIFAGLFRIPAVARQSSQRDAPAMMTAAVDTRETAEMRRFHRYIMLYAQMRRETQRHEGGLMQVAAVSDSRVLLASAKSRPSLLPQDIEIGAPAARTHAAELQPVAAPKSAAAPLSVATLEPQPVAAAQDEAGRGSAMLLALAPALSAAEIVATAEPQAIAAAVEHESRNALLLALATRQTAAEVRLTLEPQPVAVATRTEVQAGLASLLAQALTATEMEATLEPQLVALATRPEVQSGLASLLAQAPPAAEPVATLEPQPIPAAPATERFAKRALLVALADAPSAIAVAATREPLPISAKAAQEPDELRSLALALVAVPQPRRSLPVQTAQLQTEPVPHANHAPQSAPTVIVVALSQHVAAPAPAAHAEMKEVRIERRAPRYFTDYRGAMFFM